MRPETGIKMPNAANENAGKAGADMNDSDILVIKSAEFVTSAVRPGQYPGTGIPEVAFAGRSNVGKSSLINSLLMRKKLVRTSRTPGRTQLINFFNINKSFMFVDLPGYGYAKAPQNLRASWGPMIETYLDSRENLRGIVQIMDLRHPPMPDDIILWAWLKGKKIPAIPVLTKADKLSRSNWKPLAEAAGRVMGISPGHFIIFSAQTQQGRGELLVQIRELISF